MRKLLIGLLATALAASAAFAALRADDSAEATNTPDPTAVTLRAANVNAATIKSGTTADGTSIFHATRADGALCAGFDQAVLCPPEGKSDLFADGPIVTVAVAKLVGWSQTGSLQLGSTQRVIGFVRPDVASVIVIQQDGAKRLIGIKDGAFELDSGVESIQAIDSTGQPLGTTVLSEEP